MNFNFKQMVESLKDTGYPAEPDRVRIKVANAEARLRAGLDYFTGKGVWNEENYRPIVEWLEDNKGRGLLINGGCGLGKSLIGMRIIPILVNTACRKVVSIYRAQDLVSQPDAILSKHIIYIDDVGTENVANKYGNKRIPFMELCDLAEIKGKLLILTTNLDIPHLEEKYGERTIDRLRAITKCVTFRGKSLRK